MQSIEEKFNQLQEIVRIQNKAMCKQQTEISQLQCQMIAIENQNHHTETSISHQETSLERLQRYSSGFTVYGLAIVCDPVVNRLEKLMWIIVLGLAAWATVIISLLPMQPAQGQ